MISKEEKSVLGSILFIVGCCFCLTAQTTFTEKTVYGFFPKPKKVEWLKHYKGRIDGINDISVTLAYDGKSCKGLLTYVKSGERLRLDGELNGKELKLLEVDQSGAITGQLEGDIEDTSIQLSWSNFDNTVGSEVSLTRVLKEELASTPCGNDKWIRVYKGTVFGSNVDLILQKKSQNELVGTAYFEIEDKSYDLKGEIVDFDNLNISFKDEKSKLKGTLEGVFKDGNSISANYFQANGIRIPSLFISQDQLEIDCIEYADYITSYDIIFPKTSNYGFNQWMDNLTAKWIKDCKQHSFEARSVHLNKTPELRSSIRAYAWCDVNFYDKQFISGFITFENTWENDLAGRAFNFDLKNNREISLDDIFQNGFDYNKLVEDQLNKEINQHELYKNYDFREWMATQDFPYFLIQKDGLVFCTAFNSVYGRHKVKIPYENLKPFFNENNVLENLIE